MLFLFEQFFYSFCEAGFLLVALFIQCIFHRFYRLLLLAGKLCWNFQCYLYVQIAVASGSYVWHTLAAETEYGIPLTAAVAKENVMGCQFHPEKSGKVGLSILSAFCGL